MSRSNYIDFSQFQDIPVSATDTERNNVPKPCPTFKEFGLNDFLLRNIEKSGYKTPTPIQQHGIPIITAGRDLIACAQTGSGKMAAFLLPMIHQLMIENVSAKVGRPYAVIMTPTPERCTQIYNEAQKFVNGSNIKCCQIRSGIDQNLQRQEAKTYNMGCHILVATPGYLKNFSDNTYVTFEELKYLVLDEADHLLDMEFAPTVEKIMNVPTMIPTDKKRQTLMISAKIPNEIQIMAGKYLHEYIFLTVGFVVSPSLDVEQNILQVGKFEKRNKLMEILNAEDSSGTMVFVETSRMEDFLASYLSESGHSTTSIHGLRKQYQRQKALDDFNLQNRKALTATGGSVRWSDIADVQHVIIYDIPKSIEDYMHHVGRTVRKATSFFDPEKDGEIAPKLKRVLIDTNSPVPDFLHQLSDCESLGFGGTDFRQPNNEAAPAPAHGGDGDDDEEW